jgi:hypothetical protein
MAPEAAFLRQKKPLLENEGVFKSLRPPSLIPSSRTSSPGQALTGVANLKAVPEVAQTKAS